MRPAREKIESAGRTYFVNFQTAQRRTLFRVDRWAALMQQVLEGYRRQSYLLHAYVIMPDHLHILLSPLDALERSVQKLKGGFSFRAKRELGWNGEIWQPGFSDHRIRDREDWYRHIAYIKQNSIQAGLCSDGLEYSYLQTELDPIPQRLKPLFSDGYIGGAEAPPLQETLESNSTLRASPFEGMI